MANTIFKPHRLQIKQADARAGHIMTGASTVVRLDGKLFTGITKLSFRVDAKSVAKVQLEMVADVEIDGRPLIKLKKTKKA